MFRKIHSNRNPKDTVFSELRKEFGNYFNAAGTFSRSVLERRPKLTYGAMVFLMAISLVFSFTCFKHRDKPKVKTTAKVSPVGDGFSRIIQAGEKLKMTLALKYLVDSLSAKKSLSAKDSLLLDSALDRLQSIQKSIK
jgi:hypothetical protein